MTYEAEIYANFINGFGLPVSSFYDLPVDVAATLIHIQNDLAAELDDMADDSSNIAL